ncbi:low-complexity tail membrane protein [Oxynema aestuarii]|jgi:hypothetical protein|uniref:Low-complexity tail membrane protein n=1 Tax=Oxynema aestuarii AP17 TaxID=2064643 RepID=A0A6H1U793_9CYAN|nr:low-complexity tail membrane protein [Oxynema aestuarii]QIZ73903.1 low-complexity tail membrane protein [Oxynema aestuarii AP17]RMH75465.1 MAG: low-complexity tail membrane protein [Cyanobacteria bacterium J007]
MRAFWFDPFLWIHLAGIAALPLFLELCWIGFALGDPILPVWLEFSLPVAIAVLPVVWMQWSRPFYIFSILVVALKPIRLTDAQRRLLTLFKRGQNRFLALIVPVVPIAAAWFLYRSAPAASGIADWLPSWRLLGLAIAAISLLAAHLFIQVPVSVLGVMLAQQNEFEDVEPFPVEQIPQNFSLFGLDVDRLLPELVAAMPPSSPATADAEPSPADEDRPASEGS